MMFPTNLRFLGFSVACALMVLASTADAQSYRGRRAGSVTARGSIANCNMAGMVFTDLGRNFSKVDGGRCVLNGARFQGGEDTNVVPLDGMDLSHSQWVAVDFGIPVSLRYANANQANFSAIHYDGEPVENVDATGFLATKAKFHGAQMEEWYVQGAAFDEAEFSSAVLTDWTTADEEYFVEMAPENMRAMSAQNTRFENCLLEDCIFAGGNFSGATFLLTKLTEDSLNGANFTNAMFDQTDFLEVSLSGSNMRDIRIDQCKFEDCNLAGAQLGSAMIRNTSFKGATMRGVSFEQALVDGVDFTGTNLKTCNLSGAVLKNLVGTPPKLPKDYVIKWRVIVDDEGNEVQSDVYDIAISESRYNDGLRKKRD